MQNDKRQRIVRIDFHEQLVPIAINPECAATAEMVPQQADVCDIARQPDLAEHRLQPPLGDRAKGRKLGVLRKNVLKSTAPP